MARKEAPLIYSVLHHLPKAGPDSPALVAVSELQRGVSAVLERKREKPSLTDRAYQQIRRDILVGIMPPGRKLVVNDLVEEWDISPTPIKEALNRLVAEELVETVPRRGMRVRVYTAKDIRETFEVRKMYEAQCCRYAVERIDDHPETLEALKDVLEKSRVVIEEAQNYTTHYHLDEQFHMLIVSLCDNGKMTRDYERMHAIIMTFGTYASQQSPLRRMQSSYEEHKRILQGLVNRSKEEMEAAMLSHLDNAVNDLLTFFDAKSGRFLARKSLWQDDEEDGDS